MEYRAVSNRCAVHLASLNLPLSDSEALSVLQSKGFTVVNVDMLVLARQCVNTSIYRRSAKSSEAPTLVNCSSFIKWLYGKRGIWLPRRSVQQRSVGVPVANNEIIAGDLVFSSGWTGYYHTDPADRVGHVGMVTESGTVIHAASRNSHVTESSLESFIHTGKYRGARRYLPKDQSVLTLEIPSDQEVETADDFRWIILQSLKK